MEQFFRRGESDLQIQPTVFSRPRLTPDKATPYGEPLPKVTELARGLDEINREYEEKRAALTAEMEKAQAIQHRLASLQRVLDEATANLKRAGEQRATFEESLVRVRAVLLLAWSKPNSTDYSYIVSATKALEDYPRVKEYLQGRVAEAETALVNFKRENRL